MSRLRGTEITPLDQYCMIEIAKGTAVRQAFLKCPVEILGAVKTYQGFREHWYKANRMRVDIAT